MIAGLASLGDDLESAVLTSAGNLAGRSRRNRDAQFTALNQNGQKIGAKGHRTRQLLIETTVRLLETQGLRDLSVVDVAREASTSPATFYVYFRGVPEVVLAALEAAEQTSPELEALVSENWLEHGCTGSAESFVDLYTEMWNRNRTIFGVRNMAAEEGDQRFIESRGDHAKPMLVALSRQVQRAKDAGRVPAHLTPIASAAAILIMLERLSSVGPQSEIDGELTFRNIKQSVSYMVAFMLGSRD